jgi:hypothetical protein
MESGEPTEPAGGRPSVGDSERSLARRGLAAVTEAARREGLGFDDPVVLRDRGNLLVHLRPAPVVARVATVTGTRRPGDAWLRREVSIAGHLAARGMPVVPPSAEIDPGPHTHDGIALSSGSSPRRSRRRSTLPRPAGPSAPATRRWSIMRASSSRWGR